MSSKRFWLAVVIFSLIGQVAWVVENMYLNVFIYEMFGANEGQIALMVALSSVSATLTTLLIGALSDKVGKRKIFISGGYIAWGVSILGFSIIRLDIIRGLFPAVQIATAMAIGVTLVIILDCIMTFFGSLANDACFNAWLTDKTDYTNRGKAEGINAMMPLIAILVVFGGFMSFDLSKPRSWTIIFIIIGIVVILIGILGLFIIEDSTIEKSENEHYFKNIIYGFRPSVIKSNAKLYFYLIMFAVFNIAIQIFMPYLILYYDKTLQINYVFVMAPAVILAAVFSALYGRVYDKIKFNKAIVPAIAILIVGFLIMSITANTAFVFVGSLLVMSGYLSGMTTFGAVIREYTPQNKSGMFQGLRIVSQVLIPGVIGPSIGAAVLKNAERIYNNDGTTTFLPNRNIFIASMIVTVVLFIALLVIFYIQNRKKNNSKKVNA